MRYYKDRKDSCDQYNVSRPDTRPCRVSDLERLVRWARFYSCQGHGYVTSKKARTPRIFRIFSHRKCWLVAHTRIIVFSCLAKTGRSYFSHLYTEQVHRYSVAVQLFNSMQAADRSYWMKHARAMYKGNDWHFFCSRVHNVLSASIVKHSCNESFQAYNTSLPTK